MALACQTDRTSRHLPDRDLRVRLGGCASALRAASPQTIVCLAVAAGDRASHLEPMFTIEHEFDATVVTLIDDAASHRQDDVTINAFEDCVTVEQFDPREDRVQKITLSLAQLADLTAALNLPEGVYRQKSAKT